MTDTAARLPYRHESQGVVRASVDQVFAHLDDHTRLAAHMDKPSWRLGGGRMTTEIDEGRGQTIGSRIRLAGRVLGVALNVEEVVTERMPGQRKTWETIGTPRLLVIGHYRMGFELAPQGTDSLLRVFIDYALPETAPIRWLWGWVARRYARWCTQRMLDDAVQHYSAPVVASWHRS